MWRKGNTICFSYLIHFKEKVEDCKWRQLNNGRTIPVHGLKRCQNINCFKPCTEKQTMFFHEKQGYKPFLQRDENAALNILDNLKYFEKNKEWDARFLKKKG